MNKPKTIHSAESLRLCAWLNAKRKERDISIRQLSELLQWSPSIVGKVLVGDRRLDVVEYVHLCNALGIDTAEGLIAIQPLSHTLQMASSPHS